ncbi:MAG: hypothetical protein HZA36_03445 [Parcubacteria group bacterium]|nr:hypothetical protein [Parcubacteria group bacterium]
MEVLLWGNAFGIIMSLSPPVLGHLAIGIYINFPPELPGIWNMIDNQK